MHTDLVEGFHGVKHALRFAPQLVEQIEVADPEAADTLAERLAPDVRSALRSAVRAPVAHRTGVQARVRRPVDDRAVLTVRDRVLVVLDEPRDLGNVGAAIRVAAAADAAGVAVTGTVDPWAGAVLRGAAGLHYALPVLRVAPEEVGGPIVVLSGEGSDQPLSRGAALVVGSERRGVSAIWRDRADTVLALPMREGVSSLNLATAVAAALYRGR